MKLLRFNGDYVKLAAFVIIFAAALRFILAALSHPAGDSCWHLSVARFMAENGRLPFNEPFGSFDRQFFSAAPLFHLAAAFVYRLFSFVSVAAAESAVKLVSPLFGSVSLVFVYLLGKKMFGSRVGFFATVFAAFLPLHINSSVVSFVDSLAFLLAVAAAYFLIQKRLFLSALLIGLGMEAKQTMAILLPFYFLMLLVYSRGVKLFISRAAVSAIIIAVTGLPWFIRNYVFFKNPVWPFLPGFFGGMKLPELVHAHSSSIAYLFSPERVARFYFEMFGAPVGSLDSVSFVNIPLMPFFLAVWIALALLFMVPAAVGLFSIRIRPHLLFFFLWIASFAVIEALFMYSTGLVSARYFLPAIPAIAVLWAVGLDMLLAKASRFRFLGFRASVLVVAVVVGSALAFSAVEAAKTAVAAKAWSVYDEDYRWVRENTPEDALIGYNGQCMSYNVHRLSNFDLARAGYVWVNQGFRLEAVSILEPSLLQQIESNFTKVYDNSKTGTRIFKN